MKLKIMNLLVIVYAVMVAVTVLWILVGSGEGINTDERIPEAASVEFTAATVAAATIEVSEPPVSTVPSLTQPLPDLTEPPETTTTQEEVATMPPFHNNIDPSKPMIALSFDDGPADATLRILDLLEKYNSRATFFVLGERIAGREFILERTVKSGSEVAGHTWTHRNLAHLNEKQIEKELLDTNKKIESVIGTAPSFYRPPFGVFNDKVKNASRNAGLAIVNWSVDAGDWRSRSADCIYDAIINDAHNYAIVISHDLYDFTADAMERVIPELVEKGYQLVTISELMYYCNVELEAGKVYFCGLY